MRLPTLSRRPRSSGSPELRELEIKAERLRKEQENAPEIRINEDEDELSKAELYQTSHSEFDTKTELTRYLKLPVMLRDTDIY